jgi:hypothetical protein
MAGTKGRSGRRKGSLSWSKNPTAVAGHHLQTLIEMWLAGVPIKVGPDQWLVQPIERMHTVPPKVKRVLAQFAIGHMLDVRPDLKRPGIAEVLAWTRRRAPANTLCDRSGGQQ